MTKRFLFVLLSIAFVAIPAVLMAADVPAPVAAPSASPVPAAAPAKPVVLKVGDMLPAITLPDGTTGKPVKIDVAGESKIAITFMNTACKACQQEIALLSKIAEKNPGVKIYAVAVDMRGKESVAAYEARYDYKVTYLLDPDFSEPPKFGFSFTPALVVADKSGKILALKSGFNPGTDDDEVLGILK